MCPLPYSTLCAIHIKWKLNKYAWDGPSYHCVLKLFINYCLLVPTPSFTKRWLILSVFPFKEFTVTSFANSRSCRSIDAGSDTSYPRSSVLLKPSLNNKNMFLWHLQPCVLNDTLPQARP